MYYWVVDRSSWEPSVWLFLSSSSYCSICWSIIDYIILWLSRPLIGGLNTYFAFYEIFLNSGLSSKTLILGTPWLLYSCIHCCFVTNYGSLPLFYEVDPFCMLFFLPRNLNGFLESTESGLVSWLSSYVMSRMPILNAWLMTFFLYFSYAFTSGSSGSWSGGSSL